MKTYYIIKCRGLEFTIMRRAKGFDLYDHRGTLMIEDITLLTAYRLIEEYSELLQEVNNEKVRQ